MVLGTSLFLFRLRREQVRVCKDTLRQAIVQGDASTSAVRSVLENKTFWNRLLPVKCRWWGNKAALSNMLVFRNKSGCVLPLCIIQCVVKQMKGSNFLILSARLFLKLVIKCCSENAEAVELIKGKQQTLLYQKALKEKRVRIFFSLRLRERWGMSYRQWRMSHKNQWDPLNCLVTMDQKSLW